MEADKKDFAAGQSPLDGQEEATAGFDPYVSDLLQGKPPRRIEERRRRPRDKTPSRRRSILASGKKGCDTSA